MVWAATETRWTPTETCGLWKRPTNSAAGGGGVMILAVMILAVTGGTHRTGGGCMECTPCARPCSSPPPPPGLENGVQLGPSSGGARPASREPATAVANPDSTQAIRGAGWSRGGQGNGGWKGRGSRESVFFIGTQFSILYTSMYSPAVVTIDLFKMTAGQGSAIDLWSKKAL